MNKTSSEIADSVITKLGFIPIILPIPTSMDQLKDMGTGLAVGGAAGAPLGSLVGLGTQGLKGIGPGAIGGAVVGGGLGLIGNHAYGVITRIGKDRLERQRLMRALRKERKKSE